MVLLINNKTLKEYPIYAVEKNGVKRSAEEEAKRIMMQYPTVFTLKKVTNKKAKDIIEDAKASEEK